MKPENELSASEAASAIRKGEFTSEALVEACLERISVRESAVGAWQFLDPDLVLEQARMCDQNEPTGPLHGVPIGVKDIIETDNMPTTYGSPIYDENSTAWNATCVTLVRNAGAVIMGKTVSTEFAAFYPGKTANPHNLEYTPGGSSSGSAAAVADFMVPVGFATQTAASIIRPAAFCGVVGYKPSYGSFSLAGVKTFAESVDTLGTISRTLEDAILMRETLLAVPKRASLVGRPIQNLRVGLCRTHQWAEADTETHETLESLANTLAVAGSVVEEVTLPSEFQDLIQAHQTIMTFEGARNYAYERLTHSHKMSEGLMELLNTGLECSYDEYLRAQKTAVSCRHKINLVFDEYDLLLTPSAAGAAPKGLDATGDPIFSRMWTLLHVPSVTVPIGNAHNGLPIGVQFVARFRTDDEMLLMAQTITCALG